MQLRNDKVNLTFRIIVLKIHVFVLRNTFCSEPKKKTAQTYNELKCVENVQCKL